MTQIVRIARNLERIPTEEIDFNQDGRVTPGEMAGATLLLVLFGFVFLNLGACALGVLLGLPLADFMKFAPKVIAAIGLMCLVVGVGLLAWRLIAYEKQERVERRERDRRYLREDYEFDVVRGVAQQESETRWNDAVQSRYARLYFQLSYELGHIITRDEWAKKGLSPEAWNRINELARKRRIRAGRSSDLQHETLSEAWGAWCDAELQSRAWVKSGGEMLRN